MIHKTNLLRSLFPGVPLPATRPQGRRIILGLILPALLLAHVDPGTEPGVHDHEHSVVVGEGSRQYRTVPHWGELPGGKPIGPTHGGVVVDPEDGRG